MHGHRHKNGAAPFVRYRKAAPENKQWHKRGKMCVRCGEQKRAKDDYDQTPKIAPRNAVDEKSEHKLLDYRRDRYGEHDDYDSLLDSVRSTEELDNILLARATSKKPLRHDIGEQDYWISEE